MGGFVSKYLSPLPETIWFSNPKKRKRSNDESDDLMDRKHKRKKFKGLSQPKYVYKKLFVDGIYSDITIVALNKTWHLHRVHLQQCPYFASMLSGAWKESAQDVITIDIVDPNITVSAMDSMFQSLYTDEVVVDLHNIVPLLATGSHFQMDNLVDRCSVAMMNKISCETVLHYYNLAEQYGLLKVKEATFLFLLFNIVFRRGKPICFQNLCVPLMTELIASRDLVVLSSEQNVYTTLIWWLYFSLTKKKPLKYAVAQDYFRNRSGKEFLLTEEGEKYQAPFRALRLKDVICVSLSLNNLLKDRVVPLEWINEALTSHCLELLRINEDQDHGPTVLEKDSLATRGTRLGKVVKASGTSWYWPGLRGGMVLSWSINNDIAEVTRVRYRDHIPYLFSNSRERRMLCRISVHGMGKHFKHQSPVLALSLALGQKVELLRMPENMKYPIFVQVEILLTSNMIGSEPVEHPADIFD